MTEVATNDETVTAIAPRRFAKPDQIEEPGMRNHPLRILNCAEGVTQDDLRYMAFWKPLAGRMSFRVWDRIEANPHVAATK